MRIIPAEKLIWISELNHLYQFENDSQFYYFLGLQKQMLFMRCAFESRQEQLTIYPFPGLKVINIRGQQILASDIDDFEAGKRVDGRLFLKGFEGASHKKHLFLQT